MRENIVYILYTNSNSLSTQLYNDRFDIVIIRYNLIDDIMMPNMRSSTVYVDAAFTQSISGKEMIQERIKPYCKEFYLI